MERLVAVREVAAAVEDGQGEALRRLATMVAVLEELCPWVTPVALGTCTFPVRGPSRLMGGDVVVLDEARRRLADAGFTPSLGVAPGLFGALLAASLEVVVGDDLATFLAPFPVAQLGRPNLTKLLPRLGVRTLGQFAELEARAVYARFGSDALHCHRVASGLDGELAGSRDDSIVRRLDALAARSRPAAIQVGFDGGSDLGAERAASAARRLQDRLGPEAVVVARPRGGRGPSDRNGFVPFGAGLLRSEHEGSPWPAHVPTPAPARVCAVPLEVQLVDEAERAVLVRRSGLLSAPPHRVGIGRGRLRPVLDWAGPWPVVERWWSEGRRRARLQVLGGDGVASLLVFERQGWWLEAVYD